MIHQAVHGGHHDTVLILHQMAQNLQPLPREQIAMDIRTVKQQILCRVKPYVFRKAAKIIVDLPGSLVIISHHQFPGKTPVFSQPVHQVYLLGIKGSRCLDRSFCLF